ncbi:hypothetical protein BGZ99_006542 [Dissophora globulifera]|uniref:Cytochrome P450 n=1 Tax=Dissophora globulifera TaxID=979702 RepID=A0A9P6RCB5_9FUNG|nr:hypothetical protein BGZ99_006542 [Dissophora globulifera]
MAVASTLMNSVRVDPLSAVGTFVALLSSYIFYRTYLLPNFLSPLRHIPGPPNRSKYNKYRLPFLGNFPDIIKEEAGVPHREWIEKYGGLVRYLGIFCRERLLLADPKAIQHVFGTNSYRYHKPTRVITILGQILGKGVLLAEGDAHKKQRKMLNPAFGHKHIKEMVSIMVGPSKTLGKMWEDLVSQSENGSVEFDITTDLGRATLDIIGLAGFGYDFQALTNPNNELSAAYRDLFGNSSNLVQLLRALVPMYVYVPFKHNQIRWQAIQSIDRVSVKLIADKRAQAIAEAALGSNEEEGKDLMSVLIRGNEQVGSLEDGKLNDTELKDQILTFLAAGHETTSVTVTWMLHIFSTHQDVQRRVRDELLSEIGRPSDSNAITYDALNALPYLNACVKELLRVIPPVPTTSRVAGEDDQILGYDIPKGTEVFLSPAALHKLKSVYGDDAEDFVPERWMDPATLKDDQKVKTKFVTPDMHWAYLPFLTGPRNCIGSKFALIETKVLIYYLLINLEYHPAPGFTFKKAARITWRPLPGMRLVVKSVSDSPSTMVKEQ